MTPLIPHPQRNSRIDSATLIFFEPGTPRRAALGPNRIVLLSLAKQQWNSFAKPVRHPFQEVRAGVRNKKRLVHHFVQILQAYPDVCSELNKVGIAPVVD